MDLKHKEHYRSLGLGPEASEGDIRRAYRRRIKECHPDVTGKARDSKEFRAAQEAYEVLSDAQRKQAYDAHAASSPSSSRAPFRPEEPPSEADIELVLSTREAARGGRVRIPLSNRGCSFCRSFGELFGGGCPFCGARREELVLELQAGVADGSRISVAGVLILVRVRHY